jgi:hypothetical protein
MCLQHDNTQPHTALHNVKQIQDLKLEVLHHPPYSPPDLTPSDLHLFRPLKDTTHGHNFKSDVEIKDVVHDWLTQQPKDIFS